MRNGITRLYNAIWYTQVGRALEQADEYGKSAETDHIISQEDFQSNQSDTQHDSKENRLLRKGDTWRNTDFKSPSDLVFQKILIENMNEVRKTYDEIIQDKQDNIQRYKQAIGQLIAIVETKKSSLKGIRDDIDKLEKMKVGVTAKSKVISQELRLEGLSEEDIKLHPDYIRCINSYNDFHVTIEEKTARVTELEQNIERAQADIDDHKNQITELHRDLEKIKTEQSEAIADIITAREQQQIKALLSDINDN